MAKPTKRCYTKYQSYVAPLKLAVTSELQSYVTIIINGIEFENILFYSPTSVLKLK